MVTKNNIRRKYHDEKNNFAEQYRYIFDLRQDQQDGIRRIIEQTKKELSDLRRSNRPKVRMVIERAEREIREKLTAEQEKKFDGIVDRKKRRAKKFKKRERFDRR